MLKINRKENLGTFKNNWLEAKYHFSFSNYYNPKRTAFGVLKVINDDIVRANSGFDMHSHNNMEIITYIKSGAISHKDNHGNEGKIYSGDIQVMSAGTGISHSEFNHEHEDASLYQIWILPNKYNIEPAWQTKSFPKYFSDTKLPLLVSGDGNAPLFINQDAYIYGGLIKENITIDHPVINQIYILVSNGQIQINNEILNAQDGAEVTKEKNIKIKALKDSEILIIDVPSNYTK